MKHLKRYKLFERKGDHLGEFRRTVSVKNDPLVDEIEDYLSNLVDDNEFEVETTLSWGLDKYNYKEKYKDRWHLLKQRLDGPCPIRVIIHKLEDDDDYDFYYFDEIKSEVNRMVDMLSDRFDCIVDTQEIDKNEILFTDIILLPKIVPTHYYVKQCLKSKESYDFVSRYLDIIDYESYINNDNLYQICAYYNNTLISVSIFRMKDGKIHLNYSAVDDNYRKMGINKSIKEEIIEFGKRNGCSIITANVRSSNVSSKKSLLSVGFKINDSVKRYYPDGEEKISLYLNI